MTTNLCNINGTILPEANASIPVLDRGFLFGDSVYEVIRTRNGIPFAWREHLARLRVSAEGLGIPVDLSDDEVMRRIKATMTAAGDGEKYVRIILTRGTGSAPNIGLDYAPGPACWLIMVRNMPNKTGEPAKLALIPRLRNDRRALDPAIKSGNYLNNILGLAEAKKAGATDCLFLNGEGNVTEASTSNVFAICGGKIKTPPLAAGLLVGITRALLLACCAENGWDIEECDLSRDDVVGAEELFLSSSLRDLSPVTHLDGAPVGDGQAGARTLELLSTFSAFCDRKAREDDGPAADML